LTRRGRVEREFMPRSLQSFSQSAKFAPNSSLVLSAPTDVKVILNAGEIALVSVEKAL
jgi:hypothetical protein